MTGVLQVEPVTAAPPAGPAPAGPDPAAGQQPPDYDNVQQPAGQFDLSQPAKSEPLLLALVDWAMRYAGEIGGPQYYRPEMIPAMVRPGAHLVDHYFPDLNLSPLAQAWIALAFAGAGYHMAVKNDPRSGKPAPAKAKPDSAPMIERKAEPEPALRDDAPVITTGQPAAAGG